MKLNKKIISIALFFVAMGSGVYYLSTKISNHSLVNLVQAKQEFEQTHDTATFENRKQQLFKYYTTGGYEKDIQKVCEKAWDYFKQLPPKSNSLIIFDVDDTAFYNYQWRDDAQFIWSQQPALLEARKMHFAPAIQPTLNLYNKLIENGFKIIFLSSRNQESYNEYYDNLIKAGYINFEKLILMPDLLAFDRNIKTADWKLQIRKELAQQYSIVGCVGDRDGDFKGGYTGYEVRIPNYIFF